MSQAHQDESADAWSEPSQLPEPFLSFPEFIESQCSLEDQTRPLLKVKGTVFLFPAS